jgi:release factor glutamine methyltransferase
LQTSYRFMGLDLVVDGDVLAPRSETELLGRTAVSILKEAGVTSPLVIDMCCGSGNLACALASALPAAHVLAADLTDGAVRTARLNVERLGLADRVIVRQGDLFAALADDVAEGQAMLVVCNPPYISTGKLEGESAHLLETEPREAFDGGPYGISILQRLVREAPAYLAPGGYLAFEFGAGQERQAASLIARAGLFSPVDLISNDDGVPRVAVTRLVGEKP